MRLDPNRTSDDIDLAYVHAAEEHALAVQALERAFQIDLGDYFSFEFTAPIAEGLGEDDGETFSARVRVRIGDQEWVSFGIDLARPAIDVQSEMLTNAGPLTGVPAVDALPEIQALSLSRQLAEKTCAMFERHGPLQSHSSRARDLVDIAMIAMQVDGIPADQLVKDIREDEQGRLARGSLLTPLPSAFALDGEQVTDWRARWTRATRNAPVTFDDALATVERFLTPVLAGEASGRVWVRDKQSWD